MCLLTPTGMQCGAAGANPLFRQPLATVMDTANLRSRLDAAAVHEAVEVDARQSGASRGCCGSHGNDDAFLPGVAQHGASVTD
jgi:hypothetical protein